MSDLKNGTQPKSTKIGNSPNRLDFNETASTRRLLKTGWRICSMRSTKKKPDNVIDISGNVELVMKLARDKLDAGRSYRRSFADAACGNN